jgi:type I restriction enzyme, S subunit
MSKERHLPLDELVYLSKERIREHKDPRLPYIGLEHMAQGKPFLIDTALSSASVSTNCVFEPGDILFGKLRPNLKKSIRVDFPGYCSTDILVLPYVLT